MSRKARFGTKPPLGRRGDRHSMPSRLNSWRELRRPGEKMQMWGLTLPDDSV
jgi:hypothetical protein